MCTENLRCKPAFPCFMHSKFSPATELRHVLGQSLELVQPGLEAPLWRYVYGGKPKPFFHPLHTPAGFCVSLFEPHDHIWHRGLWFTIKYVNGENFWEERGEYGCQVVELPPTVAHGADGSIHFQHQSSWQRHGGAGIVLQESRSITYVPLAADAYALDFDICLTAVVEAVLDRTPFDKWGGYGGLILRGNRNWQKTVISLSDGSEHERPLGAPAAWGDLSGTFDGGANKQGGVALLEHPDNLRYPTPWYGATGAGHYLNAAFLFHEPLTLPAGEELRLRYRVLVHDGIWEGTRLQEAWDGYARDTR